MPLETVCHTKIDIEPALVCVARFQNTTTNTDLMSSLEMEKAHFMEPKTCSEIFPPWA